MPSPLSLPHTNGVTFQHIWIVGSIAGSSSKLLMVAERLIYLLTNDSARWHQQLAFRDALRIDPDLVRTYADLKIQLAKHHRHDREAYTAGKQLFINEVLTRHAHDN